MILSSGGFAVFEEESDVFSFLGTKFRNLSSLRNRRRLLEFFLQTERCKLLGLERSNLEKRVLEECANIGDFLRIMMEELCRKQNVSRWVEKTPDNVLYLRQIKLQIPDALIIHIIRDGRDVAISLSKWHGTNFGKGRFFVATGSKLVNLGVFWKWLVQKGRLAGKEIGRDYCEIRYEDLITAPQLILDRVGQFIQHDLDYERILQAGVGAVSRPDTSFAPPGSARHVNPVGRWKKHFSSEELAGFEALNGDYLQELGYPLASDARQRPTRIVARAKFAFLTSQLEAKLWVKSTPLGPFLVRGRYQMRNSVAKSSYQDSSVSSG
jgi:Sulfotransferase family